MTGGVSPVGRGIFNTKGKTMEPLKFFRKRTGRIVKFNPEKIEFAINRAIDEARSIWTGGIDMFTARWLRDKVVDLLNDEHSPFFVKPDTIGSRVPKLEEVQDAVEYVIRTPWADAPVLYTPAFAKLLYSLYSNYRKEREKARASLKVLNNASEKIDVTDKGMLLQENSKKTVNGWDRNRLEKDLEDLMIDNEMVSAIAKRVERAILKSGLRTVSSDLIVELVNNELTAEGIQTRMNSGRGYFIDKAFVDGLICSKSKENSNITGNNPEAISMAISGYILKNWAFDNVFSNDVVQAHLFGLIYLHDADFPTRVYCSSHSVEYLKKYGLKGLINLNTVSNPAKSASVLTGHINTFLASMQAYYAGALGLGYVNMFYAPYLRGKTDKELHQIAQELIFNCSQNAFSKGSQSLFIDVNVCTGVINNFKDVPAIGVGGKYLFQWNALSDNENITPMTEVFGDNGVKHYTVIPDGGTKDDEILVMTDYGDHREYKNTEYGHVMTYQDFEPETQRFCKALLTVWGEGDANGHVFEFPKCDFHVNEETFSDPKQRELFDYACEIAAKNGSTYFVFDRDSISTSSCCRLRVKLDESLFKYPESLRSCGFMNVTVNLPQCSYRTNTDPGSGDPEVGSDTWNRFIDQVDKGMDLAVKAHLQKKKHIARLMSAPNMPMWQVGKKSCDGKPYIDLEKCVYIIGLIGLDDACRYLFGKSMYEDEKLTTWGLSVIAHMNLKVKEYTEKHGITFSLEESPAESAARKLARSDLAHFPKQAKAIVHGAEDAEYYTNSIHIPADAPVALVERIIRQAMFHGMIDSGAITHAFIGEETPSAGAIAHVVELAFRLTQSAQITFSPEFTYCLDCGHGERGLKDKCLACGSDNVVGETRVVGYFSRIQNWNKSKRYGELVARHKGRYGVETAGEATK